MNRYTNFCIKNQGINGGIIGKQQSRTRFFVSEAGDPIPLDKRTSWVSPAIVWAGCEFAISVIMTGARHNIKFYIKGIFGSYYLD